MSGSTEEQLLRLREELAEARRTVSRLSTRNEQLVASTRDLSSMLAAASRVSADQLRAVVAMRRLLEVGDANEALRGLEEILVNVIGTEDFVVLARTDGAAPRAIAGMGPAWDRTRGLARTSAVADDAAAAERGDEPVRVVPLRIADRTVATIIIHRLLPHRSGLDESDEQVLDLLSSFAAGAVLLARYHREWPPFALEASA